MLNVIGQMGPLLGTRLYPDEEAPFFTKGMAVCAGFMLGVAVLAVVLRRVLKRANERRMEGREGEYVVVKEEDGEGDEEEGVGIVEGMGKRREDVFVYIL